MLRAWPLAEQIAFFENELQLPLAEEPESSKLFPRSNKARDVRDGLLAYATRAGATLRMNTVVTGFTPVDGGWRVELDDDPADRCRCHDRRDGWTLRAEHGQPGTRVCASSRRLGHAMHPRLRGADAAHRDGFAIRAS